MTGPARDPRPGGKVAPCRRKVHRRKPQKALRKYSMPRAQPASQTRIRRTPATALFIISRSTTASCRQQCRARASPCPLPCACPASGADHGAVRGQDRAARRWRAGILLDLSVCVTLGTGSSARSANTPLTFAGLKKGDTIAFGKRDIVDWMYMDAGTMKGNYSARAILRQPCREIAPHSSAALGSNSIFDGCYAVCMAGMAVTIAAHAAL